MASPTDFVICCRFVDAPHARTNPHRPWIVRVEPPETGPLLQNMFWDVMRRAAQPEGLLAFLAFRPAIFAEFPVDPMCVTYRAVFMHFNPLEVRYITNEQRMLVYPKIVIEEGTHLVYTVVRGEGLMVG
ncbi:hypothetical protein C8J56DRAFT_1059782 [Mycena floridula]|nr:hypothetical protein C8J56DRAFT_1059782 [Mycena floridula]